MLVHGRKKKIAMVINTLSGGGAERTVSNLSKVLSENYDIDIIVNDQYHLDYPYNGRILSLGLPQALQAWKPFYQSMALARRVWVLCRQKRRDQYTAVLSFSELCNLSNILSGNRYTRTIVSVRNSISRSQKRTVCQRFFHTFVFPVVFRKADMTVSCSREIADELITGYGLARSRSHVIYNGLDLETIRRKAEETLPEQEQIRLAGKRLIVSAGRMTHQKGQWHLLRVVRKLLDDGYPVHLIILGDGELRSELQRMVTSLGLNDSVSMPGFAVNPYRYIARATVFVMSSLHEGFCNAILEALACGVPVVSTDHPTGAREILAPGTDYRNKVRDTIEEADFGILVPVNEHDMDMTPGKTCPEEALMAEAIERILTSEELAEKYRHASRVRAEQLTLSEACRHWIKLIEQGEEHEDSGAEL